MSADLEGRLQCFNLSDILQLLSFSGQTGTLTLSQGWNSRTLTFEKGRLTYIAAATRLPSVGEFLVQARRITPDQLRRVVAHPTAQNLGVGPALIELGLVTPDEVRRCVEQQLEETIYSLFLWRNSTFTFDSSMLVTTGGIAIDLTAERLVMDGTRRVDEWISISPEVPSVRMTYRRLSPSDDRPPAQISEQDAAVLAQIDGRRDVVALARECGLTQFETARTLARLCRLRLAQATPPDRVRITQLFKFLVEAIYLKLTMFGHSALALDFEMELDRFAREHGLKVRAHGGRVPLSDLETPIESTALIDLYKLFIAIQQNRFSKILDPDVVQGLVEGLYLHVDPDLQELLRMYEFYQIEGLLRSD